MPLSAKAVFETMAGALDELLTQMHQVGVFDGDDEGVKHAIKSGDKALATYQALRDSVRWVFLVAADGGLIWVTKEMETDKLYDVAKRCCHDLGLPWTDPRTGKIHQPPKPKPSKRRKKKTAR